jgi:hypothetical protein
MFCQKDTCSKCIEQYLIGRPEDAHCLHCRVNYHADTLQLICTKTYLKQVYFQHRQEILIAKEKANLPPLQDVAMARKQTREKVKRIDSVKQEMKALRVMRDNLDQEYRESFQRHTNKMKNKENVDEEDLKIREYNEKREMYSEMLYDKKKEISAIRWDDEKVEIKEEKEERKKFIRRCTRDNCQGFLSQAWKCGMCEYYSCCKCFMVKTKNQDEPHECKPEDVETANMIKLDSKPCPKCGEFIMKTGGCSQMFCISCKTSWDWNTGNIVTSGPLHNPHYYEWMKRTGGMMPRNPADVPCGGFPDIWELRAFPRGTKRNVTQSFYEFHRICQEIQDVSQRTYRAHIDQDQLNEYHIQFLLNDITEKQWGRYLAMNEKKRKRDSEVQEVFMAFRTVAVELIMRVQQYSDEKVENITRLTPLKAEQFLVDLNIQITEFIEMINKAFEKISRSYSYSVPFIDSAYSEPDEMSFYYLRTKNYVEKSKKKVHEMIEEFME